MCTVLNYRIYFKIKRGKQGQKTRENGCEMLHGERQREICTHNVNCLRLKYDIE